MSEFGKDVKMVIDLALNPLKTGCGSFSREKDLGTGKVVDLCEKNVIDCPYYEGPYQTHGKTEPEFPYALPKRADYQLGTCRLQKDAIRIGPIILWDKGR